MGRDLRRLLLTVAAAGAGMAFLALPWVPRDRVNPLAPQFALTSPDGKTLLTVLRWHDEACKQGDVAGFLERVTPAYAENFARRLQPLGRRLDAAALHAYVGPDASLGLAPLVQRGGGLGRAAADRACLIVGAGEGLRGVHGLAFWWDGTEFRLDAVEHEPSVDLADRAAVDGYAQRLLRR